MNEGISHAVERQALSDEEVVRRVRAGETELFEILMRRHNQRVYRLCRAVLPKGGEAEDVAQDAWVRAYAHLDQFAGRAAFSTWVSRIAIHEAWARARRGSRFASIESNRPEKDRPMSEIAEGPDPERQVFGAQVRSLLEAAVESLPETYRTVFMLREIEELSTAETAECLELSEEAVKTRLHRARSALREELLAKAGPGIRQAFPFLGSRCDHLVERVFARIRGGETPAPTTLPIPVD